jgi:hypothetical protein
VIYRWSCETARADITKNFFCDRHERHTSSNIVLRIERLVQAFLDLAPRRDRNDVGVYWYLSGFLEAAALDVDDVRGFPCFRPEDIPCLFLLLPCEGSELIMKTEHGFYLAWYPTSQSLIPLHTPLHPFSNHRLFMLSTSYPLCSGTNASNSSPNSEFLSFYATHIPPF